MKKHVVEGPGGSRSLTCGSPESDQQFRATLNTDEALHWVMHYKQGHATKLAKGWLKDNYGTDNPERIRKLLAQKNRPKRSWQDNPLLYAAISISLTVTAGLALNYFNHYLFQKAPPTSPPVHAVVQPFQQQAEAPKEKRRFHLPRWLRFRAKSGDAVSNPGEE